jgi:aminoglycoside phosphotransferase (APT) family kinase protein
MSDRGHEQGEQGKSGRPDPWQSDINLDAERAAELIAEQFPELSPVMLEHLGTGWDNTAYVINGRWVFRFPRRQIAAQIIENEVKILPCLAPRLPLPVPCPCYVGRPTADYPHVFAGYDMLAGTTACSVPLSADERAACAEPLARFLACLHGLPHDIAPIAPGDTIARADMKLRVPLLLERLAALEAPEVTLEPEVAHQGPAIRAAITTLSEAPPWHGQPRWSHGDLYARHILIGDDRQVCGVIDWGDVHLGDPAIDLSIAHSFLPASAHPMFRAAYGPIDDATWSRARYRALFYGVTLVYYGRQIADAAIAEAGRSALRFALA